MQELKKLTSEIADLKARISRLESAGSESAVSKERLDKPAEDMPGDTPAPVAKESDTGGKTCPGCGSLIEQDTIFCADCGKKIIDEKVAAESITTHKKSPRDRSPAGEPADATTEKQLNRKPEKKSPAPIPRNANPVSEADIGMKWFGLAGITLVVVAFAFFVKYAIDNQWIGPTTRIIGGLTLGIALIMIGRAFNSRKRYQGYDRTLIGGGFALLYFTIYAAYHFYGDFTGIPLEIDLAFLSIVVAAAILFSVALDSPLLAGEAFLLGYATAYLCGAITTYTLFYNIVLAVGLIYLVGKKGWLSIGAAGLIATYAFHIIWLEANADKSVTNLLFLFFYSILFIALGFAEKKYLSTHNVELKLKQKELPAQSLYIIYIIAGLSLVIPIAGILMAEGAEVSYLPYFITIDIVFLLLAAMYSLAGMGVMALIANYAAFVVWNNNSLDVKTIYAVAFLVCIYVFFSIYAFLLKNFAKRLSYEEVIVALINTFCFFGFLFSKIYSDYHEYAGLFTAGTAVLSLAQCAVASKKKHDSLFQAYLVLTVVFITLAIPVQLTKHWFPVSWAAEALALLYLSFALDNKTLRILSKGIALIALFSVLYFMGDSRLRTASLLVTSICFFASAGLNHLHLLKPQKPGPVFTETVLYGFAGSGFFLLLLTYTLQAPAYKVAALCTWGVALLLASKLLRLHWLPAAGFFAHIAALFVALLHLIPDHGLATAVLLPQIISCLACYAILRNTDAPEPFSKLRIAGGYYLSAAVIITTALLAFLFKAHWLSIAWGIEAIVILIAGVFAKSRHVRFTGIGLLVITLGKVVFADMAFLSMSYRVISLFGIGIVFLIASFLYYRYRERIEEFL